MPQNIEFGVEIQAVARSVAENEDSRLAASIFIRCTTFERSSREMAAVHYQFKPDYTVAPGSALKERLEVQGISQSEFARRCGCPAKLISEIIAGKAGIEPQIALQFEKVLGVDASIWIGIDSNYYQAMFGSSAIEG